METATDAEHDALRHAIGRFVDREVIPVVADREREGDYPSDLLPALGALGVLGMSIPADHGGSELDLVGYAIVFEAEFLGIGKRRAQIGPFQRPSAETTLSYCVALLVSAGILFLLGRVELGDPIRDIVAQTIVLGLPATVGGAAGRLVA